MTQDVVRECELRFSGGPMDGERQQVTCDPPRAMPAEIRVTSPNPHRVEHGYLSRWYYSYALRKQKRTKKGKNICWYDLVGWHSFAEEPSHDAQE